MSSKAFFVLMYITIITIGAIYVPQPLLPEISRYFDCNMNTVSLIISVALLPLAIIPIVYGYILSFFTPKRLILISLIILVFVNLFISISQSIYLIIFLRLIEGFLISAVLTSNMTYISLSVETDKVALYMSYYIAVTIMGGFSGRLISGIIAYYSSWRFSFYFVTLSFIIGALLALYLVEDIKNVVGPDVVKHESLFKGYLSVVKNKLYFFVYMAVFCMFFVFAALTNFLPFRIESIDKSSSEITIGLAYSGYLMGIFVSFLATKFVKIFGNQIKAMIFGFFVYISAILILNIPNIYIVFGGMFIFCGGMFLIHSVASGFLNKLAKDKKGIVNGIYIASYYSGGVIGSYAPGFVYKQFGWYFFSALLIFILLIGLASIFQFRKNSY
ncbi:MAG: MFS transporter [Desulfurella sp.]|uniref:MFS transporter n=2 Tax=Desulfurellaceae TaxID=117942 RepID=UPI000CBDE380|nr:MULTISPECIES: MFS transporter [Desulfurella]PMP64590.1 MAG: MFS transporter [Desulfurella multipotens]PMP88645.1 MAG: MFS transporter [Desulfurella sp.]HEX13096.1 MFS transporter [Desulfurella acetivorans]